MDSSEGSNPKTAGGTDHGDEDDHNDLVDAEDRGDGDDARRSHDEAKTVIKVMQLMLVTAMSPSQSE